LEISSKELKPILQNFSLFYRKKKSILEKDQMKKIFAKCENLKDFKESDISKLKKISCHRSNSMKGNQIMFLIIRRNNLRSQIE
jgi:predicted RNA-binding protein with EMAP domain